MLNPTEEQALALSQTLDQFTVGFNRVTETGWRENVSNGVKLHHATYNTLRQELPMLPSNVLIQARVKATEALTSAFALRKNGRKVSRPKSRSCPVRYNERTYKLSWEKQTVTLSTVNGRITLPFAVPAYAAKYAGGKTVTADLLQRKGRWWLHVVTELDAPIIAPLPTVVGADFGINRPVVTSHNLFLGERRWRELEDKTFRLKRSLQSKGTKSAKRHLKKLAGKQLRRRKDHDHVLSKRLVGSVPAGGTLAIENLTDIRSRARQRKGKQNRRFHGWSFAQLRGFVKYKAEEKGVRVVAIDPRNTSKACSSCGCTHRNNRKSQSVFKCKDCGFELNADLNGARNIRAKFQASGGIPVTGGPSSTGLSRPAPNLGDEPQAACF
jgi:putative transposase